MVFLVLCISRHDNNHLSNIWGNSETTLNSIIQCNSIQDQVISEIVQYYKVVKVGYYVRLDDLYKYII